MDADVLIVGAGPAGAAASILLARQGYKVLLVERATFPRDKACAEYLSPACTPLLAHLGVLDKILLTSPQRLQGMRIVDYHGQDCWGRFLQHGEALEGLALPRLLLDHLLVQQACQTGVELRTGFWVRQPLVSGQYVCGVHGQQGTQSVTLRAHCVIAADGRLSTLARRLQLVRRIKWLQHIALVTHYQGVHPVRPWGEMFLLPTGYLGLAPVGDNLMNVSLVTHKHHFRTAHPEAFFEATLQSHAELRQRFAHATRVKGFLTVGPMAQRTVCPPYDGILFIGDAAGFLDPFTGQGIYLALHSAHLAAITAHHALSHEDVSRQSLRQYYDAYHHAFRHKYRLSTLIQLGIRVPWVADRVINRLARTPTLADTIVGVTGDFLSPQEVLSWRFAMRLFFCSRRVLKRG